VNDYLIEQEMSLRSTELDSLKYNITRISRPINATQLTVRQAANIIEVKIGS